MRAILVLSGHGAGSEAGLESALAVARARDGHVSVLVDTPVSHFVSMDPMGGSHLAADALAQSLERDTERAAALSARLEGQDVPFDVQLSEMAPIDALASAAQLADLVVLSQADRLAGDLAIAAKTPVLLVRDGPPLALPVARATIAWDGGDEAALALRAAVPLLVGCADVQVVTVVEKAAGFPATDALRYLARHGIKAELDQLARVGSTAECIAAAVARHRSDLLVMGAYGRSRMREFLFGGVTRHFLEEQGGPALLLAH